MKQIFHTGLLFYVIVLLVGCTSKRENDVDMINLQSNSLLSRGVNYTSYPLPYPISALHRDPEFHWWILSNREKSLRGIARLVKKYTLQGFYISLVDKNKETRYCFYIKLKKEEIEELNSLLQSIRFNPNTNFRLVSLGDYDPIYFKMKDKKKGLLIIPLKAITGDVESPNEKYPFYTPYADRITNFVNAYTLRLEE